MPQKNSIAGKINEIMPRNQAEQETLIFAFV